MTKAVLTRSISRAERLLPQAAEAYEAGVRGQRPRQGARGRRASRGAQQAVVHVSIRPEAPGPRSTMSHPSGGSRRVSALLPGATPAQANALSAFVTRINGNHNNDRWGPDGRADRMFAAADTLLPRRRGG